MYVCAIQIFPRDSCLPHKPMRIPLILVVLLLLCCKYTHAQCRLMFSASVFTIGAVTMRGADDLCKQVASTSPINEVNQASTEFVAYLSNSTHDAMWRIGKFDDNDCFQTVYGATVASTVGELLSGQIQNNPFIYNENGGLTSTEYYWTGTLSNGMAADANCLDFQSASALGVIGSKSATDRGWSVALMAPCNLANAIACVQSPNAPTAMTAKGHYYPLTVPCEGVAFVTTTLVPSTDLVNATYADQICQAEARNSPYDSGDAWQSFRALYGISAPLRTAASMLGNTQCVGSLNGRPYWSRPTTSGPFEFIHMPVFSAFGVLSNNLAVWFGSSISLDQSGLDCGGWTANGFGVGALLSVDGLSGTANCGEAHRLVCARTTADPGPSLALLTAGKRIIFTTSFEVDGNLGGLEAADEECRTTALLSLSSIVSQRALRMMAFLSTNNQDLLQRLLDVDPNPQNDAPYVNSAGAPLWEGYAQLASNAAPISTLFRDENGLAMLGRFGYYLSELRHVTATSKGGRYLGGDCDGWSGTMGNSKVFAGNIANPFVAARQLCSQPFHLICVEAAAEVPNTQYAKVLKVPTRYPCQYVFRSSTLIQPQFDSIEDADFQCQQVASSSSIAAIQEQSHNFIAIMSNSTLSFKARFNSLQVTTGALDCFKNSQERLIVDEPLSFLDGVGAFLSTYWPDENGQSSGDGVIVVGGDAQGEPSNNCDDWTSTSGQARATYGTGTHDDMVSCSQPAYLACIQMGFTEVPTGVPTEVPTKAPSMSPTAMPSPQPQAMLVVTLAPSDAPTSSQTQTTVADPIPTTASVSTASTTVVSHSTEFTSTTALSGIGGTTTAAAASTGTDAIVDTKPTASDNILVPILASVIICLVAFSFILLLVLLWFRKRRSRGAQHRRAVRGARSPHASTPATPRGGAAGGLSGTGAAHVAKRSRSRPRSTKYHQNEYGVGNLVTMTDLGRPTTGADYGVVPMSLSGGTASSGGLTESTVLVIGDGENPYDMAPDLSKGQYQATSKLVSGNYAAAPTLANSNYQLSPELAKVHYQEAPALESSEATTTSGQDYGCIPGDSSSAGSARTVLVRSEADRRAEQERSSAYANLTAMNTDRSDVYLQGDVENFGVN